MLALGLILFIVHFNHSLMDNAAQDSDKPGTQRKCFPKKSCPSLAFYVFNSKSNCDPTTDDLEYKRFAGNTKSDRRPPKI